MAEQQMTFGDFAGEIYERTGIDLLLYKQEQMLRRLRGSMARCGAHNFAEYLRLLDSDASVWQAFLERLTINVSELFRNTGHYDVLRERVLPQLAAMTRRLRIWSAGCSYGAEPVSLSITVREKCPGLPFEIVATDIDDSILHTAARGVFAESELRDVSRDVRERWFHECGEQWRARADTVSPIRYIRHNLLADPAPGVFDLIVCRNVVIYFTDEAKERVNRMFSAALKRGGYLFVGGTERVADFERLGLSNPVPFFYRKSGEAAARESDQQAA